MANSEEQATTVQMYSTAKNESVLSGRKDGKRLWFSRGQAGRSSFPFLWFAKKKTCDGIPLLLVRSLMILAFVWMHPLSVVEKTALKRIPSNGQTMHVLFIDNIKSSYLGLRRLNENFNPVIGHWGFHLDGSLGRKMASEMHVAPQIFSVGFSQVVSKLSPSE